MRVTRNDQPDRGIEPVEDRQDVAREAGALAGVEGRVDIGALVDQQDDRVGAFGAQAGRQRVGGLGLVGEAVTRRPGGRDEDAGLLERHADEAQPDPAELAHRGAGKQRLALRVEHVGREVSEPCAFERVELAGLAQRVLAAAAVLHPPQLGGAAVELVVADRGETEPEAVQRDDRRFVEKVSRHERAGPDQIARGDGDRVVLAIAQLRQRGAEASRAAELLLALLAGGEPGRRAGGVLDVAVEIVEPENLDRLDRCLSRRFRNRRAGGQPGEDEACR